MTCEQLTGVAIPYSPRISPMYLSLSSVCYTMYKKCINHWFTGIQVYSQYIYNKFRTDIFLCY